MRSPCSTAWTGSPQRSTVGSAPAKTVERAERSSGSLTPKLPAMAPRQWSAGLLKGIDRAAEHSTSARRFAQGLRRTTRCCERARHGRVITAWIGRGMPRCAGSSGSARGQAGSEARGVHREDITSAARLSRALCCGQHLHRLLRRPINTYYKSLKAVLEGVEDHPGDVVLSSRQWRTTLTAIVPPRAWRSISVLQPLRPLARLAKIASQDDLDMVRSYTSAATRGSRTPTWSAMPWSGP